MLFKELKNLKLDLNPAFVMPETQNGQYQLNPYRVNEVLGRDSLVQFMELGLYRHLRGVQIFTTVGNYTGVIHVDGTDTTSTEGAINWIVGDTETSSWTTQWFKVINHSRSIVTKESRVPGSGVLYQPEDCEIIGSWDSPCSNPTLLHVGIPHRIVNKSPNVRYCVSVRFNVDTQNFFKLSELLS